MNNVSIIGRITNDLEVRVVGNDLKVLSFSIAYNERRREKDETSFFDVTAWGRQAEVIANYFRKGHRIGVSGRLRQERFKDRDGNNRSRITIVLADFTFIEQKSDTGEGGSNFNQNTQSSARETQSTSKEADFSQFGDAPSIDDDVPF